MVEPLEFGDDVVVVDEAGGATSAVFLAGPSTDEGRQAIWVCDSWEWEISGREFRDPKGTAYPASAVRPAI